jgi:hypothetical protein
MTVESPRAPADPALRVGRDDAGRLRMPGVGTGADSPSHPRWEGHPAYAADRSR